MKIIVDEQNTVYELDQKLGEGGKVEFTVSKEEEKQLS